MSSLPASFVNRDQTGVGLDTLRSLSVWSHHLRSSPPPSSSLSASSTLSSYPPSMLARLLPLVLLPCLSAAYTFNFESTPKACDNLSISVSGSGSPPYSVLVIPFGASPLANNTEVRTIFQHNFTGDSTSTSFQLKYPQNSQFVAVVSDSSGFGSGGTSGAVTVLAGDSSSCYNTSASVTPSWVYSLVPTSLTQCSPTRIWWDETTGLVEGCV